MADFNFAPAKSNIAAQPGMSLGEMMNMATQAQALQQAQQLNPLQLQAAQQTVEQARQMNPELYRRQQAETAVSVGTQAPRISQAESEAETARIGTLKADYGLNAEQHKDFASILTGFRNDDRLKPENLATNPNGAVEVMHEISAEAKNKGIPDKKIAVLTAPGLSKALQDPKGFVPYFTNMIETGMSSSEKRALGLPELVAGGAGQPPQNRSRITGEISAPKILPNVPYIYKSTGRINPITNAPTMEISAPNGVMIGEYDIPATGLPAADTQPPTAPVQGAPNASIGPVAPVITAVPSARINPFETKDTMALAKNIQINANEAAKTVQATQFNNNQLIRLADKSFTGVGASTIANLGGGYAALPWTADAASNLQSLGHYMASETKNLATSSGLSTDAGRGLSEQVSGSTIWTNDAIKSTARINRALSTGVGLFNQGVNNAVETAKGNPFAARDFQNKWSQIATVDAFRLMDAKKNNDVDGMKKIIKEMGGIDSKKFKDVVQQVKFVDNLVGASK